MNSFDTVYERMRQAVRAFSSDLTDTPRPACITLHRDLELERTPLDEETKNAQSEAVARRYGVTMEELDAAQVEDLDIDYSVEHGKMHEMVAGLMAALVGSGRITNEQDLFSFGLAIGRRYGMIEAAALLETPEA